MKGANITLREDLEARIAHFAKLADKSYHYKHLAECGQKILGKLSKEKLDRVIEGDERSEQ